MEFDPLSATSESERVLNMSQIKRELDFSDAEEGEISTIPPTRTSTPRQPACQMDGLELGIPKGQPSKGQGSLGNLQGQLGDAHGDLQGLPGHEQGRPDVGHLVCVQGPPRNPHGDLQGLTGHGQGRPDVGNLVCMQGPPGNSQGQPGEGDLLGQPSNGQGTHVVRHQASSPCTTRNRQERPGEGHGYQGVSQELLSNQRHQNERGSIEGQTCGLQRYQSTGQGHQGSQGDMRNPGGMIQGLPRSHAGGQGQQGEQQGRYEDVHEPTSDMGYWRGDQEYLGESQGTLGHQSNFRHWGGDQGYHGDLRGQAGGDLGYQQGQYRGRGYRGRGPSRSYYPQIRCPSHRRRNCRTCNAPLHVRVNALLIEIASRIQELDGRRPTPTQVRNMLNNSNF